MTPATRFRLAVCVGLLLAAAADPVSADGLSNPFYAMDTAFAPPYRRGESTLGEQLDLVKELGFAGVAWTEKSPEALKSDLAEIERRGLKMFAIYCAAKLSPEGQLTHSPHLPAIMELLKGHCEIVWLHIGGSGPAFDALTGDAPLVVKLRELADGAGANGLKIAVYPHLGEWTARFGDAVRLATIVNHPNFGVSFNLCHCLAAGEESQIPNLLNEARQVLVTATINGADSGIQAPSPDLWKHLIQPLGQGTFDVRIVLNNLRENKFSGPIGFQAYGIPGTPREILTPTIEAWRKLSATAQAE